MRQKKKSNRQLYDRLVELYLEIDARKRQAAYIIEEIAKRKLRAAIEESLKIRRTKRK